MYLLFCSCYKEYEKQTEKEFCYRNPKTHKLHTENCRYVQNMSKIKWQICGKTDVFNRNEVCKVCGCTDSWSRLGWGPQSGRKLHETASYLRQLPLTTENMSLICDKFRVEYHISVGAVFIRTTFSRWLIYIRDDKVVKLHHENYKARKNNALKVHTKCMEGYHKQKLPSTNFYDVVCYIKNHDMGMLKRLDEKSRVEKLLEMLGE
ncbi:hypothetical protein DV740_00215 [Roseburia sp. AF02-12]|uniref:hypothetical protein n=1 Tax=Roseburia sp. AF02-12 TaxID=2293126 RepID=UPI000E51FDB6|nr:hypothetical protein [Roseburia sp. AF02-12]RGF57945.1 hypothetical protein DWZ65_09285 [Roseburia sp. AF34-16]RGH29888.1 hypothetical protein DV740_00215 [Roseburia sp. AF02-12]